MKAILVIDMPFNCLDCPCEYDYMRCKATNYRLDYVNADAERPSWCPLKEFPSNKEIKGDWENVVDVWIDGANYGYNKCLNDISGETE